MTEKGSFIPGRGTAGGKRERPTGSRQAEMALFLVSGAGNRSASMIMVLMDGPISRLKLTIVGCWQTESRWRRDSWCGGDGAGHRGQCSVWVDSGPPTSGG